MRPIIINGPLKHSDDLDFLSTVPRTFVHRPTPKDLDEAVAMFSPTPQITVTQYEDVRYYVHQFGLLGHRLVLYATQRDYTKIPFEDLKDLFDVIINDRGKEATAP